MFRLNREESVVTWVRPLSAVCSPLCFQKEVPRTISRSVLPVMIPLLASLLPALEWDDAVGRWVVLKIISLSYPTNCGSLCIIIAAMMKS